LIKFPSDLRRNTPRDSTSFSPTSIISKQHLKCMKCIGTILEAVHTTRMGVHIFAESFKNDEPPFTRGRTSLRNKFQTAAIIFHSVGTGCACTPVSDRRSHVKKRVLDAIIAIYIASIFSLKVMSEVSLARCLFLSALNVGIVKKIYICELIFSSSPAKTKVQVFTYITVPRSSPLSSNPTLA